jgi:predicted CopG family antitoxin
MSVRETTTIEIEKSTWKSLNARKMVPGESFNDVVNRLLAEDE